DDALEAADAQPFTLHLLGFGQFTTAAERFAVHQHAPFAGLAIETPQVVAVLVLLAVAQDRKIAAIGRELHAARTGAVEAGAGKDALERQFAGLHWLRLLHLSRRDRGRGAEDNGGGKQSNRSHGIADSGNKKGAHRGGAQLVTHEIAFAVGGL